MFSVQKYFSHDAKFFDLLEASADETQALTHLLVELLKDRSHPHPLHEFALARDKDKRITDQISQELVNTFITGLERELRAARPEPRQEFLSAVESRISFRTRRGSISNVG